MPTLSKPARIFASFLPLTFIALSPLPTLTGPESLWDLPLRAHGQDKTDDRTRHRLLNDSTLRSLVEAEKSFSDTSAERGIRESFLQFFADDSIIFAPEPKNGKKFYSGCDDKGRKLTWRPVFATIASSGELGVTAGPWVMAKSTAEAKPIAFGDFLSV
jgi:hypothetical protein